VVESRLLDQLFAGQQQKARIQQAIANAVASSFDPTVQNATRYELKRRMHTALDIVLQLRGDLQWGTERIADNLPTYLKKELNGERWEPSDRQIWMASDGV
jgi:hypothetical protein